MSVEIQSLLSGQRLGDVRGEFDHSLLDQVFFESSDYKALHTPGSHLALVVGRRGTGKSALAYRLENDWRKERRFVVSIAPDAEDMYAVRALAELFGDNYVRVKSAIRLLWMYALLLETASKASRFYRLTQPIYSDPDLSSLLKRWSAGTGGPMQKLYEHFSARIRAVPGETARIAELPVILGLRAPLASFNSLLAASEQRIAVLLDRLDEGYEGDTLGAATIGGLLAGTLEFQESLSRNCNVVVFVRDNVHRQIQEHDADFSRNIEPRSLRLHWDPNELLYLVAKRLKYVFNLDVEADQKIWNSVTESDLHGRDGFKRFLQHTLYRPRDAIDLLNKAFIQAARDNRHKISVNDLESAASSISQSRFDDLAKEYETVFPGLRQILDQLKALGQVHFHRTDIDGVFARVLENTGLDGSKRQNLDILLTGKQTIEALYSIGLIGVKQPGRNDFVFTHDGRPSQALVDPTMQFMLHPCYWPATIKNVDFGNLPVEEIYDDYEVTIFSASLQQRNHVLGQHISELGRIPLGQEGAQAFESWCLKAIQYCFSQALNNLELKPNNQAPLRRDVVATNTGKTETWQRILKDYDARQVTFEVKNYEELSIDEYRQVSAYLVREYGRFGVIVCRGKKLEPTRGAEIDGFREFYKRAPSLMIVKLTANWLVSALSKLRSPQKYDYADDQLSKIVDTHIRVYSNESTKAHKRKRARAHEND